ncbi:hypothetical protein N657DRAFT_640699 [Parathielavia appendiculata]|uniref:T6SS Phospholipase effector Tle1-like catalytic domain-containing protein n=1 Tax=Parathielavia appendiculata TaxID=2587402 RepID=A0AAN6Z6C5_9PEZI|nr:hypothetical protein N657DRAFT_640699 [Parathielavia appendiculata]
MAPRIIVLCDGTWCGRETGTQTNIYRLARLFQVPISDLNSTHEYIRHPDPAVPANSQVVARYRHGVGLGGSFLDYLFNGATATDLAEEVISAYSFIVNHYTPSHEVWMFGLSRGAYTVRSVAGLINNYGIIDRVRLGLSDDQTRQLCEEAYYLYKCPDPDNRPHARDSIDFRRRNSWPLIGDAVPGPLQPPVRFMGLFDTVGSLGIPTLTGGLGLNYPEFYDDRVSWAVRDVCHLVSVHDRLWAFQPCLARRTRGGRALIHEEWIPGCHYDLGRQRFRFWRSGGPLLERILSLISYIPIIGDGRTVEPNEVLSDLALWKMLQQVALHDAGGLLLQVPPLAALASLGSTIGTGNLGTGDVYGNIASYGPFGDRFGRSIARLLGHLAAWTVVFGTRDRVIPTGNATIYRYRQHDPQLPLVVNPIGDLGNISRGRDGRYPSETAESWALRSGNLPF